MNILIIQSAGEHDGVRDKWAPNHYLRECLSLQHALNTTGHKADVWGKRHKNFKEHIDFNAYDVLICIENYEGGWLPDFSKLRKPLKIQWCIDLHCGGRGICQQISKDMDIILHSTESLIKGYRKQFPKQKHIWFPNAFDSRYFKPLNLKRDIEIGFVGTAGIRPERKQWINNLKKDVGLNSCFATGEDMIERISRMKIHFNKSISVDVNYRNFETIALGTCLLTNYLPELEKLGFKDNVNCLFYMSYDECIEKIKKSLKENSWREMGEESLKLSEQHTYIQRVENILLKEL